MNLEEFVEAVQKIIDSFEDGLLDAVRRHQKRVLRRVISLLDSVETRKDGTIRVGRENRKRINKIRSELRKSALHEKYLKDVEKFTGAFTRLEAVHAEYYQASFNSFPALLVKDIASEARDRAIQTMTTNALNVGLQQPIEEVLDLYLSGGRLQDLKDTFRDRVVTQFKEKAGVLSVDQAGYLERHSGRYVRDSLNQYSRSIDDATRNAVNAKWGKFTGGRVDDTRDFCLDRILGKNKHEGAKRYYTYEEVENAWARGKWKGKNKDTNSSNIVQLLGGYNCRHSLIPVSESVVPQSSKDRSEKLGYYEP